MKNNILLTYIVASLAGLLIGYFIWGYNQSKGFDMANQMNSMSATLEGKSGEVFDQAFIKEMIIHHEGAIIMAQQVLHTSTRPELIKLANDIISAQTNEIAQMKAWYKRWYGADLRTESLMHSTRH